MLNATITEFNDFRQSLFATLGQRQEAKQGLIDAISTSPDADSFVKLSLSPHFQHAYHSVYRAIKAFSGKNWQGAQKVLLNKLPPRIKRKFHLFVADATPAPRRYSLTLKERENIHVAGNKLSGGIPIDLGHTYSVAAYLPEKERGEPPWVLPLQVDRIKVTENKNSVGAQQVLTLLESAQFKSEPCATVLDSAYPRFDIVYDFAQRSQHTLIARLSSRRTLCKPPKPLPEGVKSSYGKKRTYGDNFKLHDESTWSPPDNKAQWLWITRKKKSYTVHAKQWNEIRLRKKEGLRLDRHPFTVLRFEITKPSGELVYEKPMWLLVSGDLNLTPQIIWKTFLQRYDIEHFFRFGKQRLLLNAYQTSEPERAEASWRLSCLAHWSLYHAQKLVSVHPYPWEKYLPVLQEESKMVSPSFVQRALGERLTFLKIRPYCPRKRGQSTGRKKGTTFPKRKRHKVIRRGKKPPDTS